MIVPEMVQHAAARSIIRLDDDSICLLIAWGGRANGTNDGASAPGGGSRMRVEFQDGRRRTMSKHRFASVELDRRR